VDGELFGVVPQARLDELTALAPLAHDLPPALQLPNPAVPSVSGFGETSV
jgi:hypothetical protein